MQNIKSALSVKATANLEEEVQKELTIPTPSTEIVRATLEEDEDEVGNENFNTNPPSDKQDNCT